MTWYRDPILETVERTTNGATSDIGIDIVGVSATFEL